MPKYVYEIVKTYETVIEAGDEVAAYETLQDMIEGTFEATLIITDDEELYDSSGE